MLTLVFMYLPTYIVQFPLGSLATGALPWSTDATSLGATFVELECIADRIPVKGEREET